MKTLAVIAHVFFIIMGVFMLDKNCEVAIYYVLMAIASSIFHFVFIEGEE